MVPFEYGEFVLFLILFFGGIPVIFTFRAYQQTWMFFWAYVSLLVGIAASNLEAFMLPYDLDLIEHGVGVGLAGLLFLVYTLRNHHETTFLRKKMEELGKEGRR